MIRLVLWKDNVGENLFNFHELYCNREIGKETREQKEGPQRKQSVSLLERSALPRERERILKSVPKEREVSDGGQQGHALSSSGNDNARQPAQFSSTVNISVSVK